MDAILKLDEIVSRFDSEWVLLGDVKTDEQLHILEGTVLWHSKDRDEVYEKMLELRPHRFATIYTGSMPEHMLINLWGDRFLWQILDSQP
jgi:hypothetical protein